MGKKKCSIEEGVLVFPESACIEDAESLQMELADYVESGQIPLTLDLSRVEELDLSVIQLLIATLKECENRSLALNVEGGFQPDVYSVMEFSDYISCRGNDAVLFGKSKNGGIEIECQ